VTHIHIQSVAKSRCFMHWKLWKSVDV